MVNNYRETAKPVFPLLMYGYNKKDCVQILTNEGLKMPRAYVLGFLNNNCLKTGCVQGGIGYWQKMQRDIPENFDKMAQVEHDLTDMKGEPVTMSKDQSKGGGLVFLKPHKDYPLIDVVVLELNRNPENYFAEVEQAAFSPSNLPPGIGASPDKILQLRFFAYPDAQRYRIDANYQALPVNRPKNGAKNYQRDGALRFDGNFGSKEYVRECSLEVQSSKLSDYQYLCRLLTDISLNKHYMQYHQHIHDCAGSAR
jgi:hypothetical protein